MVEIGGDKLFAQKYNPLVFILPAIVVLTMFGESYLQFFIPCLLMFSDINRLFTIQRSRNERFANITAQPFQYVYIPVYSCGINN